MNTPEEVATGFVMGATVVGAPIYWNQSATREQALYAECMRGRGYTVFKSDGTPLR